MQYDADDAMTRYLLGLDSFEFADITGLKLRRFPPIICTTPVIIILTLMKTRVGKIRNIEKR